MGNHLTKLFATFFYIGNLPAAPGTMASFAATLIALILMPVPVLYVLFFIVVTVIGFGVSGEMEKILQKKDPSCVVIDEVAGVMISFFLLPRTWPVIITAFFLFRAFDMFKLYPVNKFEKIGGAAGIMMDDIVAGLYTNITMHIAIRLAHVI
ncbi:MAG: phosphatidylglycerophosphatase A [Candidatus Omnitrophica bacterium]|nr:phosphatidylglycerophosphatase A [Candidatus Omnitrophota bacterium]